MEGLTEVQISPSCGVPQPSIRDKAFNQLSGAKLQIDIGTVCLQASKQVSRGKGSETRNVLRFCKTGCALADILEQWFTSRGPVPASSIKVEESSGELRMTLSTDDKTILPGLKNSL